MNNFQWPVERNNLRKVMGVHEVEEITSLKAQIQVLINEMKTIKTQQVVAVCELCEGPHQMEECQMGNPFRQTQVDQANYVRQYTRNANNNPYSATYNPGWRNHPNFSYGNKNVVVRVPPMQFQGQTSKPQPQPSSINLEEALTKFALNTNTFVGETRANFKNQASQLHDLEVQLG